MSEATPEPTEAQTTTPEPPAAATTPDPTPAAPETTNIWDDPSTAKAEIERLRRENAKDRTNAKAQAAEDAKNELAQTIGKALGLVADDTPVDPTALAEQSKTFQADAKQARVELAVFRNAANAGGDPAALLDSSSFLKSLAEVDPSDSAAVTAAIEKAVTDNPRLAAAPSEPKVPAPNPAQGTSAAGTLSPADLAAQAAANGDWQRSSAIKAQQLLSLGQNPTT